MGITTTARALIAIIAFLAVSGCSKVEYDYKALGFASKAEMEDAHNKGYHTKQKLAEMTEQAPTVAAPLSSAPVSAPTVAATEPVAPPQAAPVAPQVASQPPQQESKNVQTLTYSHGKYVGEVANGKANGQGTYTSAASGTTYTGGFVEDRFNGSGTMTWKDGAKFVGTWVNDVGVQGDGISPDGQVVSGTVKNAKFIEKK